MGKSTINFPHIFFPIWSMGLFLVMGEYPIIDELGLGGHFEINWPLWKRLREASKIDYLLAVQIKNRSQFC